MKIDSGLVELVEQHLKEQVVVICSVRIFVKGDNEAVSIVGTENNVLIDLWERLEGNDLFSIDDGMFRVRLDEESSYRFLNEETEVSVEFRSELPNLALNYKIENITGRIQVFSLGPPDQLEEKFRARD